MSLPDVTRRMFGESDRKRDAGLKTPKTVIRFDDISYGDYGESNILDVYRPKNRNGEKLPVIVSVHGGGWVYGDKNVYQFYCMSLAERGFAVVNYSYRLAPEYKFPASVFDTDNVFNWIYKNAKSYGFDLENVFAVGDSAGANLLGMYINLLNDENYVTVINTYIINNKDILKEALGRKRSFIPQRQVYVKAVALNCGKYSFASEKKNPGLKDIVSFLFVNGGNDEELDMIDIIAHLNEKFPPAYIMTCTGDFLMKEAGKLCSRLEDTDIPFEYHFYSDGENPLGHVFHCNMKLDMATACNDDECRFFRRYID